MIKVNLFEVKAKLSEYLDRAAQGEHIVICRHNTPVAELRAVADARTEPRPIGPLPGRPTFELPASFFEPLPADELDLWEGVAAADPLSPAWTPTAGQTDDRTQPRGLMSALTAAMTPAAKQGASRVAETGATYRARRPARRRRS